MAQVKDNSRNAYVVNGNRVVHGVSTRDPNDWTKEFKTAKEAVEFVNKKIEKYGVV